MLVSLFLSTSFLQIQAVAYTAVTSTLPGHEF